MLGMLCMVLHAFLIAVVVFAASLQITSAIRKINTSKRIS